MRLPGWLATSPARARAAVAGLLLVCAGDAYVLRDVARLWQPAQEVKWDPRVYADRLGALRKLLPADARIGYVRSPLGDEVAQRQDLFATRYALIPRCVVPGMDEPVVLQGDLASPVDTDYARLFEDERHGWRLIERVAPR